MASELRITSGVKWIRFILIVWVFPSILHAQEPIRLTPGHQRVIQAPGITRAAIGDADIADVKALPESKQVMIMAKKVGSTDLILWFRNSSKKTYAITVGSGERDTLGEVQKLLHGVEGIEIRNMAGRVIIDGQLFRGADVERVQRVIELYPSVKNFARINAGALTFISNEMQRAFQNAGLKNISIHSAGNTLFLEGSVSSKGDAEKLKEIASSFYSKISNHVRLGVEIEPLILVDVKLMEVKSNSLGQVGMKWPASIDATSSAAIGTNGFSGGVNIGQGAAVSLLTLIEHGDAKILSNPKLLCRSGTPASFLAGGEIPIRLVGERTAQVTFKQYGVSLEITAKADATSQVYLDVRTTISDLDAATAVDGIPGILEHQVKTAANLRFGDTIALAGLIENRARKNVQKLPLLGYVPILGELFKSRDFQRNQSDFLVFLTPLPGGPKSPMNSGELKSMHKKMEAGEEKLHLSIID